MAARLRLSRSGFSAGPDRAWVTRTETLLFCVAVWSVVGGCGHGGTRERRAGPVTDTDLEVRRAGFVRETLLTGELEAEQAEVLAAPDVNIWPLTVRSLAEDGATVKQGEVVAEFDNTQLLSNLEDLRTQRLEAKNLLVSRRARAAAEISEAMFEVERQRATLEKAEIATSVPEEILSSREYAELQLALQRALLGLSEAEQALASVRDAGAADIRIQQLALEKARDAAKRAESSIGQLSLRAPRDGIAVRATNSREARPVRVGDAVWPGLAVARLPDLETLYLKARLFDVDDGRVAEGQRVWSTLDAFPETRIEGRVRTIDAVADETSPFSARRVFDVTIDFDQVDTERLRPGMSAKVVIEGERVEDALLVPREALDLSSEEALVGLVDGSLVAVELGPCDARFCVVLDGLEAGIRLRSLRGRSAETRG